MAASLLDLGFAHKLCGEIAGLVNDRRAMDRVLGGNDLAQRQRFAREDDDHLAFGRASTHSAPAFASRSVQKTRSRFPCLSVRHQSEPLRSIVNRLPASA